VLCRLQSLAQQLLRDLAMSGDHENLLQSQSQIDQQLLRQQLD
jgi:hypothetical protein